MLLLKVIKQAGVARANKRQGLLRQQIGPQHCMLHQVASPTARRVEVYAMFDKQRGKWQAQCAPFVVVGATRAYQHQKQRAFVAKAATGLVVEAGLALHIRVEPMLEQKLEDPQGGRCILLAERLFFLVVRQRVEDVFLKKDRLQPVTERRTGPRSEED